MECDLNEDERELLQCALLEFFLDRGEKMPPALDNLFQLLDDTCGTIHINKV